MGMPQELAVHVDSPIRASHAVVEPEVSLIIRMPEMCKVFHTSRQSVYRWINAGILPAPRKIGMRGIGWCRDDVIACINQLPSARPGKEA